MVYGYLYRFVVRGYGINSTPTITSFGLSGSHTFNYKKSLYKIYRIKNKYGALLLSTLFGLDLKQIFHKTSLALLLFDIYFEFYKLLELEHINITFLSVFIYFLFIFLSCGCWIWFKRNNPRNKNFGKSKT